jgi:hypothetical protein
MEILENNIYKIDESGKCAVENYKDFILVVVPDSIAIEIKESDFRGWNKLALIKSKIFLDSNKYIRVHSKSDCYLNKTKFNKLSYEEKRLINRIVLDSIPFTKINNEQSL